MEKFKLNEIGKDLKVKEFEVLEDSLAPSWGVFCKNGTWGIVCGG